MIKKLFWFGFNLFLLVVNSLYSWLWMELGWLFPFLCFSFSVDNHLKFKILVWFRRYHNYRYTVLERESYWFVPFKRYKGYSICIIFLLGYGQRICVLDTGIHPQLSDSVKHPIRAIDFTNDLSPNDYLNHGTSSLSVIKLMLLHCRLLEIWIQNVQELPQMPLLYH